MACREGFSILPASLTLASVCLGAFMLLFLAALEKRGASWTELRSGLPCAQAAPATVRVVPAGAETPPRVRVAVVETSSTVPPTTTTPTPKQTEYEERDYAGLRASVRALYAKHGLVVLQVLNRGYVSMARSWVCNVRQHVPGNRLLAKAMFVTTDRASYDAMRKFVPTATASGPLNVYLEEWASPENLTYGQIGYYQMMLFRTRMIARLLADGVDIWLTESDAVWLGDPEPLVVGATQAADMVTMSDTGKGETKVLQGGFQLLRATPKTLEVWHSVVEKLEATVRSWNATADTRGRDVGDAGSEQLMLDGLVKSTTGLQLVWLDPDLFVPGKWYNTDVDGKPQGAVGAGYAASGARAPLVILNNWVKGNGVKIARAKANRHWYLDESGERCAEGA